MVLGYCLFDLSEWHRMLTSDCASWLKAILSYWSTSCVKGGRVIPRRRQVPTFERRVFALTMKTDTFVLKGFLILVWDLFWMIYLKQLPMRK